MFYLCRHCDRGHCYCSTRCRQKALRVQRREANRRHQQSPEGRADHRDRQPEYRLRLKARVTDKSSLAGPIWPPLRERTLILRAAKILARDSLAEISAAVLVQIRGLG